MSRKKTLTAVFVILICILIGGAVLLRYKRANTTECILKGTITSIEDNVFTVVPDTSYLANMGPTYLTHADSLSFRPNGKTKVYGRYGMTEVDISELHVGDYLCIGVLPHQLYCFINAACFIQRLYVIHALSLLIK